MAWLSQNKQGTTAWEAHRAELHVDHDEERGEVFNHRVISAAAADNANEPSGGGVLIAILAEVGMAPRRDADGEREAKRLRNSRPPQTSSI